MSSILFEDINGNMADLLAANEDAFVSNPQKDEIIVCRVISAGPKSVLVSTSAKIEGIIPSTDFDTLPETGEELEVLVKGLSKETGLVDLSKKELDIEKGMRIINEAMDANLPVRGKVIRRASQGYMVNIENIEMFLPMSQVGFLFADEENKSVGKDFTGFSCLYKVLKIDRRGKSGVVSRKQYQDDINKVAWSNIVDNRQVGDEVEGMVMKCTYHGVYVMVDEFLGFVHRTNISWARIAKNVTNHIPINSKIRVRILDINPEVMRLSLGIKQLTEDPWENILETYLIGDVVNGTVTFLSKQFAFISLQDSSIEAMMFVSEISWSKKVTDARSLLRVGSEVQGKILSINIEERKIFIGMKQLENDPWLTIANKIQVNDKQTGVVTSITEFGIFVEIEKYIDGLVPNENIDWFKRTFSLSSLKKKYNVGKTVDFQIVSIDPDAKKIVCSFKHIELNPYESIKSKFVKNQLTTGVISKIAQFGMFITIDGKLDGLLHTNDMYKDHAGKLTSKYKVGEEIEVVVVNVEPEKSRIRLSQRAIKNIVVSKERSKYISNANELLTDSPFKNLQHLLSSDN